MLSDTAVCCLHTLEGSGKFQRRKMEVFFSIPIRGSQSELFKRGWSPGVEPGGVMPVFTEQTWKDSTVKWLNKRVWDEKWFGSDYL